MADKEIQGFENVVHATGGADKSEICRAGWQARNSGGNQCCSLEGELLLEAFHFALTKAFQMTE